MMNNLDFLLEVGTEEIPARMLARAAQDLEGLLLSALDAAGLAHQGSERFFTPRRLAVLVRGVPEAQADRSELVPGPSVAIARTGDGGFTAAAAGFARGRGRTVEDLVETDSPKGRVVALRIDTPGRRTIDVLAQAVPAALGGLKFPKAMRWADGRGPFVRPIHWICCLFGDSVIDFEFIGVRSGRESRGHRFMSGDSFTVSSPAAYADMLRDRHVIVRSQERVDLIRSQMDRVEQETGLKFIRNDALFDEISNIVEKPILITCNFEEDFLRLPVEVLTTAMAAHQRYFAMQDSAGRLTRTFGVVCNNQANDMAVVGRGNERVLAARLYDCRFFWENDLQTGLDSMLGRLGQRLFLKDAGTMYEKMVRIRRICEDIADAVGFNEIEKADLVRAATLCKADLMSSVVCELPEVQGIMGSYYAAEAGESPDVCAAIREHYLPRFAGDALPSADVSAALAIADRIDSIATCFHVGAIPTGSRDPLALRRAAIALLRIIISVPRMRDLTVPGLLEMARVSRQLMEGSSDFRQDVAQPSRKEDAKPGKQEKFPVTVDEFMAERFRGILTDEYGVGGDVPNSVIAYLSGPDAQSPACLCGRAVAIRDALADESFRLFLDNVFKRVGNLVRKADEDFPGWRDAAARLADPDLDYSATFADPVEIELEGARVAGMEKCRNAKMNHDYAAVLKLMASFEEPLARFIGTGKDGVPVLLEKDEGKRLARLALLDRIFCQFNWFADFTRISTR
ncbi:MAG TPA: glycine--tRNA ligase subunit beta [Myxococcota bacterium]|nr:glycine--tRNA ligase subunit beta [Myxococcota bacterium]